MIFGYISVCIFDSVYSFFEDLSIFGIVYFWGPTVRGPICHFWGADSWAPDNWAPGPDCPGPNLPVLGGGQLGPEPIWYLNLYILCFNWAPGPNCPGPSCPGPNCLGPDCPGPNLPRTDFTIGSNGTYIILAGEIHSNVYLAHKIILQMVTLLIVILLLMFSNIHLTDDQLYPGAHNHVQRKWTATIFPRKIFDIFPNTFLHSNSSVLYLC